MIVLTVLIFLNIYNMQILKRHSILTFDWNDPLGHRNDPTELREKILSQIASIFARLDSDNDG
jgi:hypothetical protein